jgi:hypothetical protein
VIALDRSFMARRSIEPPAEAGAFQAAKNLRDAY